MLSYLIISTERYVFSLSTRSTADLIEKFFAKLIRIEVIFIYSNIMFFFFFLFERFFQSFFFSHRFEMVFFLLFGIVRLVVHTIHLFFSAWMPLLPSISFGFFCPFKFISCSVSLNRYTFAIWECGLHRCVSNSKCRNSGLVCWRIEVKFHSHSGRFFFYVLSNNNNNNSSKEKLHNSLFKSADIQIGLKKFVRFEFLHRLLGHFILSYFIFQLHKH